MTPVVSVILPTYNGSRYLRESILSVLSQSYRELELIIINDASADSRVEEIILQFQKTDPRVRYERNEINLKLTKTLNKWIALARGEFIARIDDDDIWHDVDKLKKQVCYLEEHKECWLVGTPAQTIDPQGRILGKISVFEEDEDIRKAFLITNQFVHSSVLIRTAAILELGSYNPNWNYVEDYELWLRIWRRYKLHNLPTPSVQYRILDTGITRQKNFRQNRMILNLLIANRGYYPNFLSAFFLRIIVLLTPMRLMDLLKPYFRPGS